MLFAGAWAAGCGDEVTGQQPPPDDTGPGKQPPPPPENGVQGDGPGTVFAVNELLLGDTDRSGSPNPSAWKTYGFNLDNKIVNCKGAECNNVKGHCKPNAGASPSSVYPDGDDGIDNAFGKLLLPIITGLAQDASAQINESIQEGAFTIMLRIDALGTQANYVDLFTRLYAGVTLVDDMGNELIPKFDGTDEWPVAPELLDDPQDIDSSKVKFPSSYVNEHTWVSGSPGNIDLSLGVAGFTLTLKISNALIAMDLDPDRKGATNGTIAGVIPVEPLIEELRKVAGSFDEGLCTGTTFDSLADQIRQASDMLQDGSQSEDKTCDAISIGLGFNAGTVQIGAVADPAPPEPDPCNEQPMGGMGGTGGTGAAGGQGGQGGDGGQGG